MTRIDVVAGVVGAPVASGDAVSTADQSFSVISKVAATKKVADESGVVAVLAGKTVSGSVQTALPL